MKEALLLIGHGSRLPDNESVIEYHARHIGDMGLFDGVYVAFVGAQPGIEEVLGTITVDRLYVVPVFIAHGVHTREDIPRMLGIEGDRGVRDGMEVVYCEPLGTSPMLTEIILSRVKERKG